ncbi:MAG: N-acetylmuramoyl-L-alanine amidase family protein, partial [Cetobacterium sp.]
IVLSVGKYVREELGSDYDVIMTRSTDVFIPLSQRSRVGNKAKADLFVSIHINSSTNSSSTGVEVFYFSKKSSPYAEKVAAYENSFGEKYGENTGSIAQIMGELAYNKNQEKSIGLARPLTGVLAQKMKMRNRGIHGANFAVLRGFNGPGILVELGFINNRRDVSKLTNPRDQKIMAKEIANKIRAYFD